VTADVPLLPLLSHLYLMFKLSSINIAILSPLTGIQYNYSCIKDNFFHVYLKLGVI